MGYIYQNEIKLTSNLKTSAMDAATNTSGLINNFDVSQMDDFAIYRFIIVIIGFLFFFCLWFIIKHLIFSNNQKETYSYQLLSTKDFVSEVSLNVIDPDDDSFDESNAIVSHH